MKLEVGKFYKTRDGRKAECIAVWSRPVQGYQATAHIEGMSYIIDYGETGRTNPWVETPQSGDLVAEWHEPLKVDGWVNLYPNRQSQIFSSIRSADVNATRDRIACVYVSGTEGVEP